MISAVVRRALGPTVGAGPRISPRSWNVVFGLAVVFFVVFFVVVFVIFCLVAFDAPFRSTTNLSFSATARSPTPTGPSLHWSLT